MNNNINIIKIEFLVSFVICGILFTYDLNK